MLKDKLSVSNTFYVMSIIGKSLVILILIIAIFFGGTIIFINFYDPVDISDIYQTEMIGLQDISRRILTTGNIEAMSYIYSIALTVVFSVIANIFSSRKLKRIQMVEALKSAE